MKQGIVSLALGVFAIQLEIVYAVLGLYEFIVLGMTFGILALIFGGIGLSKIERDEDGVILNGNWVHVCVISLVVSLIDILGALYVLSIM